MLTKDIKLSLEMTWKECLRMWKDITTLPKYAGMEITAAKILWLQDNGYDEIDVQGECFFCQYNKEHYDWSSRSCDNCPGVMVDKDFSCFDPEYNYDDTPKLFYAKLVELYELYKQ